MRFRADPRSSGINYERIENAKDDNLRSVRIDQNLRGIVLAPEKGEAREAKAIEDESREFAAWEREEQEELREPEAMLPNSTEEALKKERAVREFEARAIKAFEEEAYDLKDYAEGAAEHEDFKAREREVIALRKRESREPAEDNTMTTPPRNLLASNFQFTINANLNLARCPVSLILPKFALAVFSNQEVGNMAAAGMLNEGNRKLSSSGIYCFTLEKPIIFDGPSVYTALSRPFRAVWIAFLGYDNKTGGMIALMELDKARRTDNCPHNRLLAEVHRKDLTGPELLDCLTEEDLEKALKGMPLGIATWDGTKGLTEKYTLLLENDSRTNRYPYGVHWLKAMYRSVEESRGIEKEASLPQPEYI